MWEDILATDFAGSNRDMVFECKMRNNRVANCVPKSLATWLLLLVCSAPSVIWGQSGGIDQPASTPQLQAPPSSSNECSSYKSQSKSKSPERIFGVVPAYTIADAKTAPPLAPRQKFGLFVKGTLDPYPFAVYALQAGVSQASDTHSGYGQGVAGYGKRYVLLSLTAHQRGFSALTRCHRCCARILVIFVRVTGVPGHESDIPSLEDLLLAPIRARVHQTGRTFLANLLVWVFQICTIQQRTGAQI